MRFYEGLAALSANAGQNPWWMVVILGFGTVFVGLICLIFIVKLMSFFYQLSQSKKNKPVSAAAENSSDPVAANRSETLAAISACLAEVMGRDVRGLKIVSLKKID